MLILGITTSTMQVGCAIGGHEGVLAQIHSSRAKRHAETLTPAIDFLRRQARIDLDEIGCVAVDVGPGLFTGLRVGIASAKAIAHALRVPMVGVSSLDLVAFPVRWTPGGGGRHDAGAASCSRPYRQVPGGSALTDRTVSTPDDWPSTSSHGRGVLLVGDGALRYRAPLDLGQVELGTRLATPRPVVGAARARPGGARGLRAAVGLEPLYLRRPTPRSTGPRDGRVSEAPAGGTAGGPVGTDEATG